MRPMKLIQFDVLKELHSRHELGVPVTRLIKDYELDISRPSLAKLIEYFDLYQVQYRDYYSYTVNTIKSSLNPEWLEKNCNIVQTQPKHYKYIGEMPLGYWVNTSPEQGENI